MRRGDIYRADVRPRSGSEQRGRRPVIVVSHDGFNQVERWRSIIVVPMSTCPRQGGRGPTAVPLPRGGGGLAEDGIALCHQVTTLDRSKFGDRPGTLGPAEMALVEEGLRRAMDLR